MAPREPLLLLSVPHLQQRKDGECLAACALMVLGYNGKPPRYEQALRLLNISDSGTPHSKLRQLEALNVRVIVETNGTLTQLQSWLRQNHPCIVAVDTGELPYWEGVQLQHAVVVVGIDENYVYLNDPAMDYSPIQVSIGDFDLAWFNQEERYGVLIR